MRQGDIFWAEEDLHPLRRINRSWLMAHGEMVRPHLDTAVGRLAHPEVGRP